MNSSTLIFVILFLALFSYWFGIQRSVKMAGGITKVKYLASLPRQYGLLTALWCGLPALIVLFIWSAFESSVLESLLIGVLPAEIQALPSAELGLYLNDIKIIAAEPILDLSSQNEALEKYQAANYLQNITANAAWLKSALIVVVALTSVGFIISRFSTEFGARVKLENIVRVVLMACSGIAVLTTLGIILSVLFESIQFFSAVPPWEFLFGTEWSPQTAMRTDQVAGSGAFGAIPLFAGTLLITAIAMVFSVPVGLMTAIYLSQYASPRLRSIAKPMLEILAGVPTVVYGFFAALTVAPFIRDTGDLMGLSVASESALAAGIVMGIMIIPFVSSLSDDAINAVPKALKEGSLGMGATLSETIKLVLLPAAIPGIVGAILLAVSRAIGETMIVVMAAGMAANLTANPLESVTTVTVQIVTLLTGDQEFDSPKTLAAFALGLMLFVTTLALNVFALKVVRKYREQYD
ncbi:phosphate ABC transporter permease subunit PstC [Aliikangiella coralliicola]|uniref:Phosphate transport system permease protein n=1 Tax=Aliikangiella coralliicola TaxID=2592383 RepID=A0A545UHK3_9GAMM|nr:phosphate ABC transporter permease subunit PstC [Aliikangiella coralliicola]TQV88939.1 phosphate ABC transporter permease subunit PstC [Aliikangiella coralliicola]